MSNIPCGGKIASYLRRYLKQGSEDAVGVVMDVLRAAMVDDIVSAIDLDEEERAKVNSISHWYFGLRERRQEIDTRMPSF